MNIFCLVNSRKSSSDYDAGKVIETHGGWPEAFAPVTDPDHKEYPHLKAADAPEPDYRD